MHKARNEDYQELNFRRFAVVQHEGVLPRASQSFSETRAPVISETSSPYHRTGSVLPSSNMYLPVTCEQRPGPYLLPETYAIYGDADPHRLSCSRSYGLPPPEICNSDVSPLGGGDRTGSVDPPVLRRSFEPEGRRSLCRRHRALSRMI
jgi:hypothetical protein